MFEEDTPTLMTFPTLTLFPLPYLLHSFVPLLHHLISNYCFEITIVYHYLQNRELKLCLHLE